MYKNAINSGGFYMRRNVTIFITLIFALSFFLIAEEDIDKADTAEEKTEVAEKEEEKTTSEDNGYDWELHERWVIEFGAAEWFEEKDMTMGMTANPRTGNILVTDGYTDQVIILNGRNGEKVGTLPEPENGFSGGLLTVSQVKATPSGLIAVCNFTPDASEDPFKIYLYQNEQDEEPEILVHEGSEEQRMGDSLAITEDLYGNISILAGSISPGEILQIRYSKGYWNVKELEVEGDPSFRSMAILPDGSFYTRDLWGRYEHIDRFGDKIGESEIQFPPYAFISNIYIDIEGYRYIASAPVRGSEHSGHDYLALYNDATGTRIAQKDISNYTHIDENNLAAGSVALYPFTYTEGGFTKLYVAALATNNYLGVWEIQAPVKVNTWDEY